MAYLTSFMMGDRQECGNVVGGWGWGAVLRVKMLAAAVVLVAERSCRC